MKQKRILMSVAMAAIVLVSLCAVSASALSVSAAQGSSSNVQAPTLVGAPVGAGAPGVCSNNSINLYLFIRGGNNSLILKISPDGTTWPSNETQLGGVLTSSPAANATSATSMYVFARGLDNALWSRNTSDGGVTWSNWISLGGQITANTGPAACSWSGNLAVFVQGTDGSLWWRYTTNGGASWNAWASLGGKLKTAPAATAMSSPNEVGVFGVGLNNAIWYKHLTASGSFSPSSWDKWVSVGGQALAGTSPAAYNWGQPQLGWFVTGTDSQLYRNWVGNSAGYENIGGVLTSSPAATARMPGYIDVFARGSTGQFAALYQISYNYPPYIGQWGIWTAIGGV